VYAVRSSNLPQELRAGGETFGFAGPNLDLALQRFLEQSGQWCGRGGAMVLNDLAIREEVKGLCDDDQELAETLVAQRIRATSFHELAHLVQQPLFLDTPPCPSIVDARVADLARWCQEPHSNPVIKFAAGHDAKFIRCLSHVLHRVEERLGLERVPRPIVFDGMGYGLSPLAWYESELAAELQTFDGKLCDLQTLAPPAGFVKLWQRDLTRFIRDLGSLSQIVADLTSAMTLFSREQQCID